MAWFRENAYPPKPSFCGRGGVCFLPECYSRCQSANLLKGGFAVFVLATGTMTVSATWNLISPNPVYPGSTQSGSTTNHLSPSRMVCLDQTHGKICWHLASWPEWGTHSWVVPGESSGQGPSTPCSCDSEMQPRGYLLEL